MIAAHELLDALADAMQWPRSRPARLISGDRATVIGAVAFALDDESISLAADDSGTAVVLLSPSSHGGGRRATDKLMSRSQSAPDSSDTWSPADWRLRERVVIDASEMFAGGHLGIDARLAQQMDVEFTEGVHAHIVQPVERGELKFVAYVPESALEPVRSAVFAAGAGLIGDYTECSWSTSGTGTFRGTGTAKPAVGAAGTFEEVSEIRFEVVLPTHVRDTIVDAYVDAHPYEEPAFDLFELRSPARVGVGRVGTIVGKQAIVSIASVTRLLPQLFGRFAEVRIVIAGSATDTERDLLTARGVELRLLDGTTATAQHIDDLVDDLEAAFPVPVSVARPPLFPTEEVDDQSVSGKAQQMSLDSDIQSGGAMRLWYDGGSRGNPGPAAFGCVIEMDDGTEIERFGEAIGNHTNNVAEYNGLVNGLRRCIELGATSLKIYSDSELIVKQIKGEYKVKHVAMKPLYEQAMTMLRTLSSYSISHVPRAENAIADALVNETLDAAASR